MAEMTSVGSMSYTPTELSLAYKSGETAARKGLPLRPPHQWVPGSGLRLEYANGWRSVPLSVRKQAERELVGRLCHV